ncbi:MAG: gamma-glutamyltransferase family protein [Saprospiraceae bacterium]|nr:gamma-glutamyltransferase family protein [Saprospiraceae bacterium]
MNTAIACGHIKTAEVIETILQAGGNAFDAAIAGLVAMTITEPCMSSLAGGGFAQVQTPDGKIRTLDFFCQTPMQKSADQVLIPIHVDFGGSVECYYGGHGACAVPGTPALIHTLLTELATMPLKELLQPAIQLAKNGIEITPFQYQDLSLLQQFFLLSPNQSQHLFDSQQQLKAIGEVVVFEELASTLDFIAEEGVQDFYVGDIAHEFFKEHQAQGGIQQVEDWENYSAIWREPLAIPFQGHTIYTSDLPSIGGVWMRSFLEQLHESGGTPLSAQHLNQLIQAFENEKPFRQDPKTLEHRFPELENNIQWQNQVSKGTSHFNILDRWGNAIALTTTIGSGCGMYIGNTGIYLNNMLGEEGLMPAGITSWVPNSRLHSNTCPTIVQSNGGHKSIILGSGGSTRIPYMIAQALFNHLSLRMPLSAAIQAPRVFDDLQSIHVEPGFRTDQPTPWKEKNLYFGGVHALCNSSEEISAVGDERREGYAKVLEI